MIDKIEVGKYYLVDMKKLYQKLSKSACTQCSNSDTIYVTTLYESKVSQKLYFEYECFYCKKIHKAANVEYALEELKEELKFINITI